jgi:peptidoglycan hydrolase-like protein with peptidoglycan-binding domain
MQLPSDWFGFVSDAQQQATAPVGQVLGAATFNFSSDLQKGDEGAAVTELQNRLTAEGVYTGPITGYFGNLTFAGVKVYQAKYGIIQTGYVGPLTRAQLNKAGQVLGVSTINFEAIQAQIAVLQAQVDALIKQLQALQQQ